jgi:N-acyl-D-aspartate/D-glutamate deacylase
MADIVREAMQSGAVGFSTSYSPQHHGWGGIPMPSRMADQYEFKTLVKAMAEGGNGVFMITKGGFANVRFLVEVSAETGAPMMGAALLHNSTLPQLVFDDLAQISEARARGRDLWGQVSCTPITYDFTLEGAYPFEGIVAWKPAMKLRGEELKTLLRDPEFRRAVRNEIDHPAPGVRRLFNGEWQKIEVLKVCDAKHAAYEQHNVAELAAADDTHPLEWLLDLALAENLKTEFTAMLLNSDEDAIAKLLVHPSASVALSDAGAHLTFICDAGFGLHLMGYWSRDKQVMPLTDAIHELTAKPAEIFRIPKRGLVREGYFADLLLFDPTTVGRSSRYKVNDLPGDNSRLHTDSVGVTGVWVNGRKVADGSGVVAGNERAGEVIRNFETWRK